MKRRTFIQKSAAVGLGAGIATQFSGCGDEKLTSLENALENANVAFTHDLQINPQTRYDALTEGEKVYLQKHFPDYTPSSIPDNHANDELFVVNHKGASKLTKTENTLRASDSTATYTYETTTNKDNYAIHMFYKKIIADTNPYIVSSEDDVVLDNLPKYSLANLVLVVPDGTGTQENIVLNNSPREIAKALIFSTPAFQHFSREDLYYALSKFDDIFVGKNLFGKMVQTGTNLENAIGSLAKDERWYYYQAYREKDGGSATLRKTQSKDDNGNIIHNINDPIYTFPLRESFAIHLSNDLKEVVSYFSADDRISEQLLPKQKLPSTARVRIQNIGQNILKRSTTYSGIKYRIDTSSLKSEGFSITLNKVDSNGLHITAKNEYNRHVQLLVLHLDEGGFNIGGIQEVDVLSPRLALMSIPISDNSKDFIIKVPDGAYTTRFILGSLSFNGGHNKRLYNGSGAIRDRKNDIDVILTAPEAYTIAFEMAIPSLLILWGANLKRGTSFNVLLLKLGLGFAKDIASPFFGNPNLRGMAALKPILVNMGTTLIRAHTSLAAMLIDDIAESEVEDSVPIVGQILRAINIAVDVSNLGQTFYSVLSTNAINIVDVTRTHSLDFTLKSDPKDNDFPLGITSIVVTLTHANNNIANSPYTFSWDSTNVKSHTTDGGPTHSTYDVSIDDIPAGGFINIAVQLKIGNWVAAHKEFLNAENLNQKTLELIMIENLIPIGNKSIYQQYAKLSKTGGAYNWNIKPNNTLLASPTASDVDRATNELLSISVNDPIGAIGYSYKDLNTNQYLVKNISAVLSTPNQGAKSFSSSDMMQLSYNLTASSSTDGHLVFHKKGGFTYVRKVDINSQSNDFNVNLTKNIGMFISDKVSQFAYYPAQGIVAGLDTDIGVLHILHHLDEERDDNDTNRYLNAQSMVKTRSIVSAKEVDPKTQYLYNPMLMTMSPSGDIVILESTKSGTSRLRAFDQYGAVDLDFAGFNNNSGVFEFQAENNSVRYLDINIESKGFIYVLKQLGSDPTNTESYFLDIYDPSSSTPTKPIVTTTGFSTAKIKVDYWRRVYALNYETTGDNEPTISVWTPPVP